MLIVVKVHSHGKRIEWPRGKGLGGSSAINYQMYNRGQALDYDDWAKLGNKGWDFQRLLPYFKKSETFEAPPYASEPNIPLETKHDVQFHGDEGPIHTSFSTYRIPIEREWLEAAEVVGEKEGLTVDGWSGNHMGSFHGLSTIDRSNGPGSGMRSYSATGYLLPNVGRANLHVLTEALVTKLVVSSTGEVTGVSFKCLDVLHTVKVKKEVILSAGVIKTPQILELSGIGDPEILAGAGVDCIIPNSLVGENLQDHPATALGYELVEGEYSLDKLQDPKEIEKAMGEYMTTRTGPMSSGGSTHCFCSYAALSTPEEIDAIQKGVLSPPPGIKSLSEEKRNLLAQGLGDKEDAAIQLIFLPVSVNVNVLDDQTEFFKPPANMVGKQGFTVAAAVCRPLSVGSIHISSSNPEDDPTIDPGYHTHPADAEMMAKALSLIEKISSTSPLKEKLNGRSFPAPEVDLENNEGRLAFVRKFTGTEYHPIGSCAMGRKGEGAVDERLRVRLGEGVSTGKDFIRGLRVVDASVFPLHVGGNIVSTVYAVGEKAADMIKEEWGV